MSILITGATGNVGRPLVDELVRAGVAVRAVSRNPETAGLPSEVDMFESVPDALHGASAVFLNSRALGDSLSTVVELAVATGVGKLVALSAINADDDFSRQPSRVRGDRNREVEQVAVASGLTCVSLRPSVFVSNFAGMWSAQIRAGDVVAGPYAGASSAPIVERDISAVAARALLTGELDGQKIPLTGPEALTNSQLADVMADVLGRTLRYQEVPAAMVRERFIDIGFSAQFADAYIAMLAETVDRPALVTNEIEKILGRPATPFRQWVSEHIELFN